MRSRFGVSSAGGMGRAAVLAGAVLTGGAGTMARAAPFDPAEFFGPSFMQAAQPMNAREAVSSLNASLGIPDARMDAKMVLADSIGLNQFSTILTGSSEGKPVKGEIYTFASTSTQMMLTEVEEELARAGLSEIAQVADVSVVSFVPTSPGSRYITAVVMSFKVSGADGCPVSLSVVHPVSVAADFGTASAQHGAAVRACASDAPHSFPPPGTPLPSGTPLSASPPSPYGDCTSKLGPRPDTTGLTDPCDQAVAAALMCLWDAACDAIRALNTAKRKTITGGVGTIGVIGGAVLLCPPFTPIGVIGGLIGIGVGGWAAWDGFGDATSAAEDASAALQRRDDCWKLFFSAIDGGACG